MTRQDYIILAQWMRDNRPSKYLFPEQHDLWVVMLDDLCTRLQRDNRRFDRETFVKAALDVR